MLLDVARRCEAMWEAAIYVSFSFAQVFIVCERILYVSVPFYFNL